LHREAAAPLLRACNEERESPLRAALLMEQAAHGYLRCAPPQARKFALHAALAGQRFQQCRQRGFAARAYRAVLAVHHAARWRHVDEHAALALARLDQAGGDCLPPDP
jgi:hypothetical protein